MAARPRLLLFDLDGVLADYDRAARCALMAGALETSADAVRDAMFGEHGLEHASDRGEIGLPGLLEGLQERHGWRLHPNMLIEARCVATHARPEMIALCHELKDQARLTMFTNNGDWVVQNLDRIAPELPPLFDALVCSAQLRQSKPDPEAFRACLRRLQHGDAAEALFIDDNADTVEGARRAGLDAVRYTDIATLRRELRARGFDLQGEQDAP
jgi:HAD superfamily hydrolase (TIGR01509 family)